MILIPGLQKKYINLIMWLLCLVLSTSCTNKTAKNSSNLVSKPNGYLFADRDNLLMQGYTANFVDGYMDGCRSGQNSAGDKIFQYTRDEDRANIEKEYLFGWEQGHRFCYEHMRDLIKNSNGQPYSYHSKEAIEREKQHMWSELKK